MSPISKRRSRPDQPDAITSLMDELEKLLDVEHTFTPHSEISPEFDDITATIRNRSINVLRCLKIWYELPSEVFILAVSIVDRFLTKMKVQTKHIPCVAVSSFYIAGDLLGEHINPDDLVNISQSKCTSRDLQRMANIIKDKLNINANNIPTTALPFLRFYNKLFKAVAEKLKLGDLYDRIINEQEMYMQLEIIACDVQCTGDLPSVVALALIFIQIEKFLIPQHLKQLYARKLLNLYAFAVELKKFCNVNDCEFAQCFKKVLTTLNLYNGELKIPYRQRLTWKVSTRTMKKLRPTKQLTYMLPTIREDSTFTFH